MSDIPQKREGSKQDEAFVEKKVVVNASPDTLYNYWRNLENLPQIMSGLKSVQQTSENRSHWVAEFAGLQMEWDAEIESDEQDRKISWRSVGDSNVWHRGSVRFIEQNPNSTEVVVAIAGQPAGESVSGGVKKVAEFMAANQIQSDLNRFKQHMESGQKAA